MVQVLESYKLIKVVIEGKEHVVKAEDTTSWNVIKAKTKQGIVTANEGDIIDFKTESGELMKGSIVKLSGKKDKTKITIVPKDADHEETWGVVSIKEDAFVVDGIAPIPFENDENEKDIDDESEDEE